MHITQKIEAIKLISFKFCISCQHHEEGISLKKSVLTLIDTSTCFTIYHGEHSPLMKGTDVFTVKMKIIYEQWTEKSD